MASDQLLEELNQAKEKIVSQLGATSITDEFIDGFYRYAKRMGGKLDNADFTTKRQIVESLSLYGTIALEDDLKVIWLHWHTDTFRLYIENTASSTRCR